MLRLRMGGMAGVVVASALVLAGACGGTAAAQAQPSSDASVSLPTGWKTASELYAKLAKLPEDQLEKVLIKGAKKEGAIIYAGPQEDNQVQALMDGFMKEYPGIKARFIPGQQQEDITNRAMAEARAGRSSYDVISIGTMLKQYRAADVLANVHGLVGDDRFPKKLLGRDWFTWSIMSSVIAYNTNLLSAAEAPKSYKDLLDPKWKGKVSVDTTPDVWVPGMIKKWGYDRTRDYQKTFVDKNHALLRKGHTGQTNQLIAGAFPVSAELYGYKVAEMMHQGAPIRMIIPKDLVSSQVVADGITEHAPHPYGALLFARYELAPDGGQQVLAQFGRVMAHPDTKLKYPEMKALVSGDVVARRAVLTPEDPKVIVDDYIKIIKNIYKPSMMGR